MIKQKPPDLLAPDRPVRSYDAQEHVYARRRVVTLVFLCLAFGGGAYSLWGHGASRPVEIPTIKAEGPYKQKPADPGGIDIPHQDVRVYDQLESKPAPAPQVEHLLPPPETPSAAPPAAVPLAVADNGQPPKTTVAPTVATSSHDAVLPGESTAKPVDTTVAPPPASAPVAAVMVSSNPAAPVAAPPEATLGADTPKLAATGSPTPQAVKTPAAAPKAPVLSLAQVIEKTKAAVPVVAAQTSASPSLSPPLAGNATGGVAVQLASVQGEPQARALMQQLQQKYASQLGAASLHLARADLGSRGVYYRIQSQGLAENDASRICSTLKQINAGCILVRK